MRMKRFKKLKREKEPMEVDITSLLDILTILLVFLLQSYNASDLTLDVADKIELPKSNSQEYGHASVIVQVGKDYDLWINNHKIGKASTGGDKIEILYDELLKEKEKEKKELEQSRTVASNGKEPEEKKTINLVLDQSVPFEVLKKVMHTSTLAGYPEFKFIVQGNF